MNEDVMIVLFLKQWKLNPTEVLNISSLLQTISLYPIVLIDILCDSGEGKWASNYMLVLLDGVMVIVLAIGPKVHGFKIGQERWISKGDKNPQHDFLRRGSKAVCPLP
jgi:hypothetical protein